MNYILDDPSLSEKSKKQYSSKLRKLSGVARAFEEADRKRRMSTEHPSAPDGTKRRNTRKTIAFASSLESRDDGDGGIVTVDRDDTLRVLFQDPMRVIDAVFSSCRTPPSEQTRKAYCMSVSALMKRLPADVREVIQTRSPESLKAWLSYSSSVEKKPFVTNDIDPSSISWQEVVSARQAIDNDRHHPEHGKNAHIILSLLTHVPPMRTSDLGGARVQIADSIDGHTSTSKKPRQKLSKDAAAYPSLTGNVLIRVFPAKNKASILVRREKDTAGALEAPFPRLFAEILVANLNARPRSWLFANRSADTPLSENAFNHVALRCLKDVFGRPVTVCDIRNAAEVWVKENGSNEDRCRFKAWMHGKK